MQARDAARNRDVLVDVSHEVVRRARFSSRDSNARRGGVAMSFSRMDDGWMDGWTMRDFSTTCFAQRLRRSGATTTDVNAEITELKRKIEQVEGEIEQVKGEIEQVKAAQKWLHVESLTDEQRAAELARAGDYANPKICPVDLLPTKLLALENQLGGLRNELGRLRNELAAEKNVLLEEARRAERASRDSNVAAVTMFSIKATIVTSGPVHWFRSLLATKLANLKSENGIVVYGSCDRSNDAITVDFLLDTMGHRTIVAGVIDDITNIQHAGGYLSSCPDETSQQLEKCIAVSVADPSSIKEWQYSPQAGSPDRKLKRDGRDFEEADAELKALFPKRTKSDDADSASSDLHSSSSETSLHSNLLPLPVHILV